LSLLTFSFFFLRKEKRGREKSVFPLFFITGEQGKGGKEKASSCGVLPAKAVPDDGGSRKRNGKKKGRREKEKLLAHRCEY